MSSTLKTNEKKKEVSNDLLKLIDLWLKWDQCEQTRAEIEQFKVKINETSTRFVILFFSSRKTRNGTI